MKKLIKLLILSIITLLAIPFSANALVVGDWEIKISGNTASLLSYSGTCPEKMTLPARLGNFDIVGISGFIFDTNVKEVILPEGYKFMEDMRFTPQANKNIIEKITLPSTFESLDEDIFHDAIHLKEINIPPKVKVIPARAFAGCSGLEKITLSEGLETIEYNAFGGCGKLKELKLPSTLKSIKEAVFSGCGVEHLIIPDSVTTFGGPTPVVIACPNLKTVVLSDNINTLNGNSSVWGSGEFQNCPKLSSIYIGNSIVTIKGSYRGGNPDSIRHMEGTLSGCPALKTLIFPEGLKEIQSTSLCNNENLESVVIPKSIVTFKLPNRYETPLNYEIGINTKTRKPNPKMYIYGYAGTPAETFAASEGFPFVDISVATPTNSNVTINGKPVTFTAYNIGGNNYFKLRDIAFAINNTKKNFNVGWDGNYNAISLTKNSPYTPVGGEMVVNSTATATEPIISNPKIFVDNTLTTFMAFSINDNNYIKLRDLGEVFDFSVEWNESTQTIAINTNKSYTA